MTVEELAVHVASIAREVDAAFDALTPGEAADLQRLRAAVVAMLRSAGRLGDAPAGWEMAAEGLEALRSPLPPGPP